MEDQLLEAAITGNLASLWGILKEDKLVLDKFTAGRFSWNPLHVAVSHGHTIFIKELISINPELSQLLDLQQRSALHLASSKGDVEIVRALIKVSPKMCLARDRDGKNPLYCAVEEDKVDVLKVLVRANRAAARVRVDRNETILHVCVKHKQFKALELLLEMIIDDEFINAKDEFGNTILHVAVLEQQVEVVRHVLKNNKMDVNAINANGHTSMDLPFQSSRKTYHEGMEHLNHIEYFLLRANGKRAKQLMKFDWLERKDILMVVASVIATMTFEAAVNPPGGVWQDNSDAHKAGESVIAYNKPSSYPLILRANTIGFLASLSSMFLLTNAFPFGKRAFMWILIVINWLIITSMAISYAISIEAVANPPSYDIAIVVMVWCGAVTLLLLVHTVSLVRDVVRKQLRKNNAVERIFRLGLSVAPSSSR